MFGIIADLISSVTTILLPAYLSIKALRSHDPAQLQPWLIYQTLLALTLLSESWFWLITWFPFYSWIRLGFLLYLVLPQTQGAIYLFQTYVEPFVALHERQIDEFIGETHQKLETMGLSYISQLIDFIREKILGQAAPKQAAAFPQDTSAAGYAQNLLSRFAMPDARTNAANLYGMLSGLSVPTGAPGTTRARDFSSSSSYNPAGELQMPSGSAQEKSNYIASERARLANMLRTLEKEQQTIDLAYGAESSNLQTSRSDASFESISHSDVLTIPPSLIPGGGGAGGQKPFAAAANQGQRRTASGNWVTSWFAGAGPGGDESGDSRPGTGRSVSGGGGTRTWNAAKEVTDAIQGMSSSVDTGDGEGPERRY